MPATTSDITDGSNIRDSYNPADVRMIYRTSGVKPRARLRRHFREEVEGGRFWEWLDTTHNLLARSDGKRRRHAAAHLSAWTLEWVATYGLIEELNTFPGVTDITREDG